MFGRVEERESGAWQDRLHYGDFFFGCWALLAAGAVFVFAVVAWAGSGRLELNYVDEAHRAIESRDFAKAVVACQRLTEIHPAERKYRYLLAMAHAGLGETERAVGLMQTLAPSDETGYPPAQLWVAERMLRSPPDADSLRNIESRLIRLRSTPEVGPAATVLLVRLYLLTGRAAFVLNEPALRAAAESVPELHLSLLQGVVGRVPQAQLKQEAQELREHFVAQVRSTPSDLAARRSAIGAEILLGNFAAASQLLRDGLTLHPDDVELQQLWGAAAFAQAQAAQFSPTSPELRKHLAREAVQALQLRPQPGEPQFTLRLAQMYRSADEPAAAEPLFREVAEKLPGARLELAEMLAAAGREADAAAEFAKLLEYCQGLPAAGREKPENILLTGAALLRLKKWDEAVKLLTPAAAKLPEAKGLLLQTYLSTADAAQDDPAKRLAALQAAIKLEPFFQPALQRLLQPLGDDATNAAARKMVIDLAAGGDAPASAYLLLGTDALLHEDPATAQKYLDLAHRLAPQSPIILNNLAWSLAFGPKEDLNRALLLVQSADEKLPNNPQIQDTHGRILMKLGRWKDALVQFQACAKIYDDRSDFHKSLSEVYAKLDLPALSKRHQERADEIIRRESESLTLPKLPPKSAESAPPTRSPTAME